VGEYATLNVNVFEPVTFVHVVAFVDLRMRGNTPTDTIAVDDTAMSLIPSFPPTAGAVWRVQVVASGDVIYGCVMPD
jgi:hypothetical protein